uniref:Bacteriophage protein n=1 Tax=viral metagenome TaxID=1070528 RepID=A0A6M3M900_9ZZZZ
MGAFIYRMPAGIAGDVTRREHAKIEPQVMDATYPVLAFGVPVVMVDGEIRNMPVGAVYTDVYGFIVRPYPSQAESSEALAVATPDPTKICDILVSGYMTVLCVNGTPAKNGLVYFRNAAGDPAEAIGQVEAESSDDNTVLTGATFMGTGDADGNVEIKFNV